MMAPNFSKLVSKNLEISFQAKICTNSPKICANSPKICTSFPKRCLNNIVTRFLNNFLIYGTPLSPGVYNDTNCYDMWACVLESLLLVPLSILEGKMPKTREVQIADQ